MIRRFAIGSIAVLATLVLLPATPARADGHATTIASFEDTVAPEGIVVADDGTIYLSTSGGGQVWSLPPGGGSTPTVVATIDDAISPEAFGILGLFLDDHTLYATAVTFNPATHGVWSIDLMTGDKARVPGSESVLLPNAVVAVDGVLYITDSFGGGVWRQRGTDPAQVWLVDETLTGNGALLGPDLALGANGLAYHDGIVLVANSDKGSVVAVPVEADGSAGTPTVLADPALVGVDGIAVDEDGVVYAVNIASGSLLRIGDDGPVIEVADLDDGLDTPSSVAVGPDGFVYVVNFSIGEAFGWPGDAGPGVVRVDASAAALGDRDIVAYSAANQEVPRVGSSAWAWSVFRLRAGTGTLAFSTSVAGISSPVVAAHLHWAARGENGPVVVDLTDAIVDDTRLAGVITAESLSGVLEGATLGDLVAEIEAGRIYLNIHTETNPGGEIRGQLLT